MRTVSLALGISVARVALAWLLTSTFVTKCHDRRKTREQLVDNLSASDEKLTPEHVALLDAVGALPLEYPGWMIDRQDRDRRPHAEVKKEVKKAA